MVPGPQRQQPELLGPILLLSCCACALLPSKAPGIVVGGQRIRWIEVSQVEA